MALMDLMCVLESDFIERQGELLEEIHSEMTLRRRDVNRIFRRLRELY